MQSFRTELENLQNPVVEKDIIDLEKKIRLFREGKIDEEKFRSLRLARGVYGQRQSGVQMVRIKLPFGRVNTRQIRKIADIAEEYASSNLHATTRQDIQIHFVSLDRTPELWTKLETDNITLREACGNTVRNITASATAGVDPKELFDVSPYAYETFTYFLRNPICQEMGRKFKIAFSASDDDSAFTYIHDIGFIPRIRKNGDNEERGFKVLIGGGLGANPHTAVTAFEFLDEDKIIPFAESVLRVFDRYGERTRRMKARFKFLLKDIGIEKLMEMIGEEQKALQQSSYTIDREILDAPQMPAVVTESHPAMDEAGYALWKETNTFEQKQPGYYGVYVKLTLGNLSSKNARRFADVVDRYASDELRITVNQGYMLRFVPEGNLLHLYAALNEMGLADAGFDSVADITACPGTESCNLGISDSTQISLALEEVIKNEYPDLIRNNDIKIKISGCPNACGQHSIASIGFHGSTIKDKTGNVLPALVVLLGGTKLNNGQGIISDKVIKIPSKRGREALRLLLDDYEQNALEGEYFHDYYKRMDRKYFYAMLKPLTELETLVHADYIDWGQEHKFVLHTAVGECAGVIIDLVATLFFESAEKLDWAHEALTEGRYADSIYHSYSAFINTAKALLLSDDVKSSTQYEVVSEFQKHFIETGRSAITDNFKTWVFRINKNEPSESFANQFRSDSIAFLQEAYVLRKPEPSPQPVER